MTKQLKKKLSFFDFNLFTFENTFVNKLILRNKVQRSCLYTDISIHIYNTHMHRNVKCYVTLRTVTVSFENLFEKIDTDQHMTTLLYVIKILNLNGKKYYLIFKKLIK